MRAPLSHQVQRGGTDVTQSDPGGHHDWHSATYVQEWIGINREDEIALLRRMAHFVPHDADAPIRILDVGGGWGPVTEVMLDVFPRAQVVLHDFSEPMLAEARRRLVEHGDP